LVTTKVKKKGVKGNRTLRMLRLRGLKGEQEREKEKGRGLMSP
jgi:hypothetical protein